MCNISCSSFKIPESAKTVLDRNGEIDMLLNKQNLKYVPDQRKKFSECITIEAGTNKNIFNATFNTLPTGQMYRRQNIAVEDRKDC